MSNRKHHRSVLAALTLCLIQHTACIELPQLPARPQPDMNGAEMGSADMPVDMPVDMCTPKTAEELCTPQDTCGAYPDGCGGEVFCTTDAYRAAGVPAGACPEPESCVARTCTLPVLNARYLSGETDISPGPHFGFSIAVSEDWIAVGDPYGAGPDQKKHGLVYLFQRDETGAWQYREYLSNPTGSVSIGFGARVALRGDALVVSAPLAPGDDPDSTAPLAPTDRTRWGRVHLYKKLAAAGDGGETWRAAPKTFAAPPHDGGPGVAKGHLGTSLLLTETHLFAGMSNHNGVNGTGTDDDTAANVQYGILAIPLETSDDPRVLALPHPSLGPSYEPNPVQMTTHGDYLIACSAKTKTLIWDINQPTTPTTLIEQNRNQKTACHALAAGAVDASGYPTLFLSGAAENMNSVNLDAAPRVWRWADLSNGHVADSARLPIPDEMKEPDGDVVDGSVWSALLASGDELIVAAPSAPSTQANPAMLGMIYRLTATGDTWVLGEVARGAENDRSLGCRLARSGATLLANTCSDNQSISRYTNGESVHVYTLHTTEAE